MEQQRQAAQMTNPKAIRNFIFGGKALFTMRSTQSGEHLTFKIKYKDERRHYVYVLAGPDNTTNYEYIGTIFEQKKFAPKSANTTSAKAFRYMFEPIVLKTIMPEKLEVWHEGRCGRCGRVLTVVESITAGFGPECVGKAAVTPTLMLPTPVTEPATLYHHTEREAFKEIVKQSKQDIGGDVLRSIATPVRQVSVEDVDRATAERISHIGVPTDIDSVLDSQELRAIIRMGCQHAMEKV